MSELDNYAEYEDDLGLEEEDRKAVKTSGNIEWYKPQVKGQTDRAAIIYFHPVDVMAVMAARKANPKLSKEEAAKIGQAALQACATTHNTTVDALTKVQKLDLTKVHFKRFSAHFEEGEGMGYFLSRLGKDGAEADEVWRKIKEPKPNFSTLLLLYPTHKDGSIDKDGLKAGKWSIKPWRFSPKRYEAIWKVNNTLSLNNLSIANQDLLLENKDPKFQQIEPQGGGPALWLRNAEFKEKVLTAAVGYYDKLIPYREMTTDQLRAKLGLNGSAVQDVTGTEDYSDLLNSV